MSADIVHTHGIASGVKLTPKSVVAGGDESSVTPIYPYLPGFGSLDLSKLDADTEQFLNNFCTAVTKGSELGSNMAAGCEYSGLLFYTDLADEWNEMFDESYPLTQDSETTPTGTAESSQTTTPLFTSFLLGEPFISDQVFQIPVRFFAVSGTVDVWLFLIKETASWKVDQIQIQKWEKTNGKQ